MHTMNMFWCYLTPKGAIMPSTIREKEGDCEGCFHRATMARNVWSVEELAKCKMVRVKVSILTEQVTIPESA